LLANLLAGVPATARCSAATNARQSIADAQTADAASSQPRRSSAPRRKRVCARPARACFDGRERSRELASLRALRPASRPQAPPLRRAVTTPNSTPRHASLSKTLYCSLSSRRVPGCFAGASPAPAICCPPWPVAALDVQVRMPWTFKWRMPSTFKCDSAAQQCSSPSGTTRTARGTRVTQRNHAPATHDSPSSR
jgi:hypothetical protein